MFDDHETDGIERFLAFQDFLYGTVFTLETLTVKLGGRHGKFRFGPYSIHSVPLPSAISRLIETSIFAYPHLSCTRQLSDPKTNFPILLVPRSMHWHSQLGSHFSYISDLDFSWATHRNILIYSRLLTGRSSNKNSVIASLSKQQINDNLPQVPKIFHWNTGGRRTD